MYHKHLVIYLRIFFGCFDFIYADIIFRRTVQPRWHLKSFFIAEGALESSSPQEEQIMHEGISTSKVSASLL